VRHNGGSVWFDELGWPWPKHPCYEEDSYGVLLRRRLEQLRATGTPLGYGIIVHASTTRIGPVGVVDVRRDDGRVIRAEFPNNIDFATLPGRLVTLEYERGRAIPSLVEITNLRNIVYIQIVEDATGTVIDEFPYPRRAEAEHRLRALDLQYPGQYRSSQVKRLE
jgi:hypothetical protein